MSTQNRAVWFLRALTRRNDSQYIEDAASTSVFTSLAMTHTLAINGTSYDLTSTIY